jgi:hypothetical protein
VLGGLSTLLGPPFDATHTILSAVRILHGQRLYRDFPVSYGPIAPWLLAPFVAVAPTVGWGVVAASGAVNALAVGAAWRIVALGGGGAGASRSAALMTAVWFLPVFGTYYMDHLAYACALAALAAYLSPMPASRRGAVAGVLLSLACQGKQSVGGAAALALLVTVLIVDGRGALRERANGWLLLSFATAQAVILGTIAMTGTLSEYLIHAVRVPAEYAVASGRWLWRLPAALVVPFGIDPVAMIVTRGRGRLLFYPVVLAVYASYVWLARRHHEWRGGSDGARVPLLAGLFLALSTLWGSILLGRLYAQVTFGVWTLLALVLADIRRAFLARVITACGVLLGLLHVAALHRSPVASPGPSGELWPMSSLDSAAYCDLEGARAAVQYLRSREGRLAVLSDSAEIIPLALGRPTFEPVEHYMEGLTVPRDPNRDEAWQRSFAEALEARRVRYLLWNPSELDRPRSIDVTRGALRTSIADKYAARASFGRYVLLERVDPVIPARPASKTAADPR